MSLEVLGLLVLRDSLEGVSKGANEWILNHCFYCKKCRACSINSHLQKELKRSNFKTKIVTLSGGGFVLLMICQFCRKIYDEPSQFFRLFVKYVRKNLIFQVSW